MVPAALRPEGVDAQPQRLQRVPGALDEPRALVVHRVVVGAVGDDSVGRSQPGISTQIKFIISYKG